MSALGSGRVLASGIPRAGDYVASSSDFHIFITLAEGSDTVAGTVHNAPLSNNRTISGSIVEGSDTVAGTVHFIDPGVFSLVGTIVEDSDTVAGLVDVLGDAVRTITFVVTDEAGNANANASGIPYVFFDQRTLPLLLTALRAAGFRCDGGTMNTDASGFAQIGLQITNLVPGETGLLLFSNTDGSISAATRSFLGPVAVQ